MFFTAGTDASKISSATQDTAAVFSSAFFDAYTTLSLSVGSNNALNSSSNPFAFFLYKGTSTHNPNG
jgi:hypothetical protein